MERHVNGKFVAAGVQAIRFWHAACFLSSNAHRSTGDRKFVPFHGVVIMTRTFVWTAIVMGLSAWTAGYDRLAAAQQSEAAAEASATEDQSGQTSTDASSQTSDADGGSQPADNSASVQTSTSADASSQQPATSAAEGQATPSRFPPPAQDAGSDRRDSQTSTQGQTPADRVPQADQPDRDAQRNPDRADASARGQVGVGSQARDGRWRDAHSGLRFSSATDRGLTVQSIEQNSVFFSSGLRRGDVIISVNRQPVRSEDEFLRFIHVHRGDRLPVVVLRDGREEIVYVTYRDDVATLRPNAYEERSMVARRPYLGVVFDGRVRDAAVVASVNPESPADVAGLQPGDEILAINGEPLRSYRDAIDIIQQMRPGERIDIDFARRVDNQTQAVLDSAPGAPIRTATVPDIRSDRQNERGQVEQERSVETRRENLRDQEYGERDDDRRGLLNRGLLPGRRN
jgi:hypothetical protein